MQADVPVSIGELLDKFSILRVKLKKISDIPKKEAVKVEHNLLRLVIEELLPTFGWLEGKLDELETVNDGLWDTLEQQRTKESKKEFDEEFISLSRAVYLQNDKRFEIKNSINELTHSLIKEQKHYS